MLPLRREKRYDWFTYLHVLISIIHPLEGSAELRVSHDNKHLKKETKVSEFVSLRIHPVTLSCLCGPALNALKRVTWRMHPSGVSVSVQVTRSTTCFEADKITQLLTQSMWATSKRPLAPRLIVDVWTRGQDWNLETLSSKERFDVLNFIMQRFIILVCEREAECVWCLWEN